MHSKLRPSPAMVVALIALFVALGGSAAALSGSNTVFSDDIVDNEVRTADVRNDTLAGGGLVSSDVRNDAQTSPPGGLAAADLQPNSVGTSEAANNSLTGADINEATLGNLPAGAWREVGAPGEPPFSGNDFCVWSNYDTGTPFHNSAAFLRDRFGFVHLKGLVDADDNPNPEPEGCFFEAGRSDVQDVVIFNLPAGYRPARREVLSTITNGAFGRVDVDGPQVAANLGPGAVLVENPTTATNAMQWVSLDGISFRCAPSGSNGCP